MSWSQSKVSSSSSPWRTLQISQCISSLQLYISISGLGCWSWLEGLIGLPTVLPGSGPEPGQAGCNPVLTSLRLCWHAGEEKELWELLLSTSKVCFYSDFQTQYISGFTSTPLIVRRIKNGLFLFLFVCFVLGPFRDQQVEPILLNPVLSYTESFWADFKCQGHPHHNVCTKADASFLLADQSSGLCAQPPQHTKATELKDCTSN